MVNSLIHRVGGLNSPYPQIDGGVPLPIPDIPYPDPYNFFNFSGLIAMISPLIVIAFLLVLMLVSYKVFRYLLLIVLVWFISFIVWISFLKIAVLPFSPFIENTFMMVQTLILLLTIFAAISLQKR